VEAGSLAPALAFAERVIIQLPADAPWTLRANVDHLAGTLRLTAAAIAGRDFDDVMWENAVWEWESPTESFEHAVRALSEVAADRPGWAACVLPAGRTSVEFALDVAALECVVHARELAGVIGADPDIDPRLTDHLRVVAEAGSHLTCQGALRP